MPEKIGAKSNQPISDMLVAPIIDLGRGTIQPLYWRIGSEETVSVKVLGNPMPAVRWQVGRRRVKESSRYSLQVSELRKGRGWQHTLIVKNVNQDIEQGLWVTADSEAGQDCIMIEIKTFSLLAGAQQISPSPATTDLSFNDANSVTSLNIWKKEMEKRNYMRSVDDLVENPLIYTLNTSFDPNYNPDAVRKSGRNKNKNKSEIKKSASAVGDVPPPPSSSFNRPDDAIRESKKFVDPNALLPPLCATGVADIRDQSVRRSKNRRGRIGSKVSSANSETSDNAADGRLDLDLSGYSSKKKKSSSLDTSATSELMVTDFDVVDKAGLDQGENNRDECNNLDNELRIEDQQFGRRLKKKKRRSRIESQEHNIDDDLIMNNAENVNVLKMNGKVKIRNDNYVDLTDDLNSPIDEEIFQMLGMNLSELCAKLLSGNFDPAHLNGDNFQDGATNVLPKTISKNKKDKNRNSFEPDQDLELTESPAGKYGDDEAEISPVDYIFKKRNKKRKLKTKDIDYNNSYGQENKLKYEDNAINGFANRLDFEQNIDEILVIDEVPVVKKKTNISKNKSDTQQSVSITSDNDDSVNEDNIQNQVNLNAKENMAVIDTTSQIIPQLENFEYINNQKSEQFNTSENAKIIKIDHKSINDFDDGDDMEEEEDDHDKFDHDIENVHSNPGNIISNSHGAVNDITNPYIQFDNVSNDDDDDHDEKDENNNDNDEVDDEVEKENDTNEVDNDLQNMMTTNKFDEINFNVIKSLDQTGLAITKLENRGNEINDDNDNTNDEDQIENNDEDSHKSEDDEIDFNNVYKSNKELIESDIKIKTDDNVSKNEQLIDKKSDEEKTSESGEDVESESTENSEYYENIQESEFPKGIKSEPFKKQELKNPSTNQNTSKDEMDKIQDKLINVESDDDCDSTKSVQGDDTTQDTSSANSKTDNTKLNDQLIQSDYESRESADNDDETDEEDDDEEIQESNEKQINIIKPSSTFEKGSENFLESKVVDNVKEIKNDVVVNQIQTMPLSDLKSIVIKKPPPVLSKGIEKAVNSYEAKLKNMSNVLNPVYDSTSPNFKHDKPTLVNEERISSFFSPTYVDKLVKPDRINQSYIPTYIKDKTTTKDDITKQKYPIKSTHTMPSCIPTKPNFMPPVPPLEATFKSPNMKPLPPPRSADSVKIFEFNSTALDDKSKQRKFNSSKYGFKHIDSDEENWPEPPTADVLGSIYSPGLIVDNESTTVTSFHDDNFEKRKKYRLRLCVDPTALRSWIVH